MGLYLKLHVSDTVHFCAGCSHARKILDGKVDRFDVAKERKKWRRTELCNQCQSKERRGACSPL